MIRDRASSGSTWRRLRAPSWWLLALIAILLFEERPAAGALCPNHPPEVTGFENPSALAAEERKVVKYLHDDWGKDDSVTSVDLAMEAMGLPASGEVRFKIGNYVKLHPDLHEVIRRWGWVTLVLTPNEKLIARAMINAGRDNQKTPSLAGLAKLVGIPEAEAGQGLQMLHRYEILKRDESVSGVGYTVAPRYVNWEPRLDFLFHTVTLSSGRRLNMNCAADLMQLVNGKFSKQRVVVDDSSPESTDRIRVVFDQGRFVSAEPRSTVVFLGGG